MDNTAEIINKVANSGLITIDLEDFYDRGERVLFDIKENLWQGLVLKEKDFRDFLKTHDWSQYQGKNVAVDCTVDAIVPTWAYMLVATKLKPYAKHVFFGTLEQLEVVLYQEALRSIDFDVYKDQKVVIKGCGKLQVPTDAYVQLTLKLYEVASSIMFGEPCSTVPVYKKAKTSLPDQ
ncbi:MAG TPA: DUF2480 family protein [Cytophagales bacterium]|nr:DUF2480 family protein [Cytophagales bacterium]